MDIVQTPNNQGNFITITKGVYACQNDDSKWIVTRDNGQLLMSDTFESIKVENNVIITQKDALYGVYSFDGVCILPCACEHVDVYREAIAYQINRKYGLVTKTGKTISLPIYERFQILVYEDKLKETLEEFMSEETKKLYSKIDNTENNWLLEDYYPKDYISSCEKEQEFFILGNESNSVVCSSIDGIICQIPYQISSLISPNALLVKEDNKYGVYSLKENKLIISCYYDRVEYLGNAYGCSIFTDKKNDGIFEEESLSWYVDEWLVYFYDEETKEWRNTDDYYSQLSIIGRGIFCLYSMYDVSYKVPTVIQLINRKTTWYCFHWWQMCDPNIGLYRPPYFLNKDLVCVPMLQNYEQNQEMRKRRLENLDRSEFEAIEKYLKYYNPDFKVSLNKKVIDSDFDVFKLELVTWIKKMGVYACAGDNQWKRIIDFKYNEIHLRSDGNFDVRINNAWGILSRSGDEILAVKYSHKVNSVYVQDANTKKCGALNKDLTREIVPTLYDSIVFDNEKAVNMDYKYGYNCSDDFDGVEDEYYENAIAVGKCEMIVSEGKIDYREAGFAVLTDELIPMTDYIYSRVRVRGNFIIAYGKRVDGITHELSNAKFTVYDIVDVYYRDTREKKCSFNDAYVCTTDNPDLFVIIHKLSNSQITKAYMCSFEDEGGWKTLDYDWVTYVDENWFIVKNYIGTDRDPKSARYGLVDKSGKGTKIEYSFISSPIEGFFFAAKAFEKVVEHKDKRKYATLGTYAEEYYTVYLLKTESCLEEDGIVVFESADLKTLSDLVSSCVKRKLTTLDFSKMKEELIPELVDKIFRFSNRKWESELLETWIDTEDMYDDSCYSRDYREYERDTWYAMTDGQYGDYPGSSEADDFYEGSGW